MLRCDTDCDTDCAWFSGPFADSLYFLCLLCGRAFFAAAFFLILTTAMVRMGYAVHRRSLLRGALWTSLIPTVPTLLAQILLSSMRGFHPGN